MNYKYELLQQIFDSNLIERIESLGSIYSILMNVSNFGIVGHSKGELKAADLMSKTIASSSSNLYAIQRKGQLYTMSYLWGLDIQGDYNEREENHKRMTAKSEAFFTFLKILGFDFILIKPLPLRKANPTQINIGDVGYVTRVRDIPEKIEWFKNYSWMKNDSNINDLKFFRINKTPSNIVIFYVRGKYYKSVVSFMQKLKISYKDIV